MKLGVLHVRICLEVPLFRVWGCAMKRPAASTDGGSLAEGEPEVIEGLDFSIFEDDLALGARVGDDSASHERRGG